MNIKSFGCSFIFGSELADDGRHTPFATPSKLTWPALFAVDIGYNYNCYARPGAGNLQIMERALSHAATNESALYIIGWTWIDRFDYTNPANDKWATLRPTDTTDTANVYYRDLHSEYRDKLSTLVYIRLVIDTLIQKKYPFIMTYMDELMFDKRWHTTPAVTDLQDYIQPYMTTFEGKSFLHWSLDQGFAISDKLHPLEHAHAAAAKYIQSFYNPTAI